MALKDFIGGFSAEARKQKAFDKTVAKLVSRNHQHEERMWCIDHLAGTDSPEAMAALFRRWDMTADKKREDVAEKEYLAEVLVSKGVSVLPFVQEHNNRSVNVTWPLQVLGRLVTREELVTEILRVLAREQERLASFKPEKKLRLIQLLADHGEDARLTEGVLPSISDFDSDVRFEAVELIRKCGDDTAKEPLLARLVGGEEDSARVQDSILKTVAAKGWSVLDRKEGLLPLLGSAYRIGPKGSLIRAD